MQEHPSYDELLSQVSLLESMVAQREAQDENTDAALLYRKLFEQMLFEVHIWELVRNQEGEILSWRLVGANPAALKTWGKTLDEVKGKLTDETFPDAHAVKQFLPIIRKIFQESVPQVWESYFQGTDQVLSMISIPVGERFISCGVDVTPLRTTERELLEKSRQLNTALSATINSVSRTLGSGDPYTAGHQQRGSLISEKIADELALDPSTIEGIKQGALIHDIGKIAIPSDFLTKPTQLSDMEFEVIKTHTTEGARIMADIEFPWPIREIILQHHERLDGSGYPSGLKGDEIIMEVRIIAVSDVFESMVSDRPYRAALGMSAALEELGRGSGKLYDETVVSALGRVIERGELHL
ncbi:MAG: HD domain-containing protein [Proteobacteria bacterium]|nr:HD domain-containing protein [Pseudomonadota bacterium]